jgi:EmrB/QacA subfamily drug resistance transporter
MPSRAHLIALLAAAALFMNLLDGTVITTALPAMARAFGTSAVNMNLGITVYLLALAVFMPASGWTAARFGPKRVFAVAIGVFIIASVACAVTTTFPMFLLARAVQAMGAAMMQPVGRLVVLRVTPKHQLMNAMAMMVWPALLAPIAGPPIGGYITTFLGWPWIFYLNVPLGIAAIVATLVLFPPDPAPDRKPFDILGFGLIGIGCFTLLYGLDIIGQPAGTPPLIVGLIVCSAVCFVSATVHLNRSPHPLFDLAAVRIRTFAVSVLGGSLGRLAIGSVPFLLPLMFQLAFNLSAAASGLLLFWLFAGNLATKTITTAVVRHFGFRNVLLWNGVFTAVSIAACAALTPRTPFFVTALILFVGGAFRSLQFTSFSSISFADVPQEHMTGANTLSSMMTQLSSGLGVAVGALAVRAGSGIDHTHSSTPSLADFHIAFLVVAAIGTISLIDVIRLPADAGRAITQRLAPRSANVA